MKISPEERHYIIDWCLLLTGAGCGLGAAWILAGFGWSFPGELERARDAGMVSLTTLYGYPKSRDLLAYLLTLFLPVIGAIIAWLFNRQSSNLGKNMLTGGFDVPTRAMRFLVFFIPLMTGYFAWNVTTMLYPKWNQYVGAWIFLGEQGATMAWAQSIISGGVYGRDFFSLYGPMFIYPLTWLMDLLGNSILVEQLYKWLLDIIAFAMLGFMLVRTLRARWLALLFVVILFLIYPSQFIIHANSTILRTVLGMFPIVCIALWVDTKRTAWFIAGGLLLGQSLLFSQEAGLCATLAIAVMLLACSIHQKKTVPATLFVITIFSAILLISLTPMVGFLVLKGAGPGFLDCIIGYPKAVMMGFEAMPFPSLREWLGGSFYETWINYAVISVYSASAVALCVAWIRGVRSSRFLWALGLLIYGILLYRVALGRSNVIQTMKIMIPSIMLSALWIDELLIKLRNKYVPHSRHKSILLIMLAAVLINFFGGICLNPVVGYFIISAGQDALSMNGKFTASNINGIDVKELPRLGEFVDKDTAIDLLEINNFLKKNTKDGEYVYFFPSEAVYYFLFNRTNPTRYPVAYFAATYERQREVIRDLERNRPRYVVYSRKTWRIDGIPEHIRIPEIVNYLNQSYTIVMHLQAVDILERIDAR